MESDSAFSLVYEERLLYVAAVFDAINNDQFRDKLKKFYD